MKVGVLTGGGDCPGLNAVIRAVTKSLISQGQCEVIGIADGFEGLMGATPRVKPLTWDEVSGILHIGGTIPQRIDFLLRLAHAAQRAADDLAGTRAKPTATDALLREFGPSYYREGDR